MKAEYNLLRSRRKTVALIIKKDATLEVRAPLKMSRKAIDEFILAKQAWIEKNLAEQQETLALNEEFAPKYGKAVLFFGEELPIIPNHAKKAILTESAVLMPDELEPSEIKAQLVALYKAEAARYIKQKVAETAETMQIHPSSVRITSAKTRWGSCTADRLSFSWYLIMADKRAVDYVIVHELSHIVHHNHSDRFWALVGCYCPNYKQLRASLKPLGKRLTAENWD